VEFLEKSLPQKFGGAGIVFNLCDETLHKTCTMSTLEFNNMLVGHSTFLRGFALNLTRNSDDADDLIQDTMVKALRYKNSFREGTNFKGWLYTIMRSIFLNNRKKLKPVYADLGGEDAWMMGDEGSRDVESQLTEKDIWKAIEQLRPDLARVMNLYLQGYRYEEVAEQLGIPLGTVKSRIFHARKQLIPQLEVFRN
jgi:RNA polymerase sigma-70 factor (ECF subfamily)